MKVGGGIFSNSISIITGNFLNKAVSIALLYFLTGYLAPSEFGRYSFVIAYVTFFGIFTDFGINTMMTREISGGSITAAEGFGAAIAVRFILTVVTGAVMIASLALMGYPHEVVRLAAAASLALFISFRGLFFRNVFEIPFQVNLKMGYPAAVNFINELFIIAVAVYLIKAGTGLFWLVLAMMLANLPGFTVMAYISTRAVPPSFNLRSGALKAVLKSSMPLGVATLLEGVFIIIPVFLLSRFSTEEALGLYSLSFRLVSSLWIMPVALMVSMLPRMSRDVLVLRSGVRHGFFKGLRIIVVAGVAVALLTGYFSHTVIRHFTGPGFMDAAPVLTIMIWGTFAYAVNTAFYYAYTAAGLQKVNTVVWSTVSVLSAVLCVFLIPVYHATGAAISFVASLAAGVAVNVLFCRKMLGAHDEALTGSIKRLFLGIFVFAQKDRN